MAPILSSSITLGFAVAAAFLFSPSLSLTCTSQNFTSTANFSNCNDLPTLTSYLHYSYDSATSSLSIAFLAAPPKPSGWISWGINPTAEGMLGTQALIAFKHSNGSMSVNTYNISSFAIVPSRISFNVSGLRAEDSGGLMKIFATLALPANTTEVFQVWQTGASVTDGTPDKHDMKPENMNAKGRLTLTESLSNGTTSGNNSSSSSQNSPQSSPENGGISIGKQSNVVFYVCLLSLGVLILF